MSAGRSKPDGVSCLHSSDYFAANSTLPIDDGVSLTATVDILKAIAAGQAARPGDPGARLCRLARRASSRARLPPTAGCTALPIPNCLFDRALDQKYERALSKIGIDPSHLVSEAGHA